MPKKYYKQSNIGAVGKLFWGAGISILSLLLFAAAFGFMATAFEDITSTIPLFAILTIILSSVTAGALVSRFITNGNIGFSLLIFLLAALVIMLSGIIAGGGKVSASVFLNLLIFTGTSTLSAYVFKKRERKFNKKFKM